MRLLLAAMLLTTAISPSPPLAAYRPRLEWWVPDPAPAGTTLPVEFVIDAAPAFTHPYVWTEITRVPLSACAPLPATPLLPARRACTWTGVATAVGSPYRWHRVASRSAAGVLSFAVVEPSRVEIEVDPWP